MKPNYFKIAMSFLISAALFAGALFVLGIWNEGWINHIIVYLVIMFAITLYTKGKF